MAADHTLKETLKKISKKYGDIMEQGAKGLDNGDVLSLRSPMADYGLYNSMLTQRIIEFCGAESSGKTSSSFLVAASFIELEMKKHPNPEDRRCIIFIDQEGTADSNWAKNFGYDMDSDEVKTYVMRPDGQSAEKVFDMILDLVTTGEVGLVILDSIATLTSEQLIDESFEKKEFGGIAKSLTAFSNRIIGPLRKYDCTLLAINQVRQRMDAYGSPWITNGGQAWKHNCSVRLMFRRGAFIDEEGNELKSSAESPAGHIINIAVLKNKVSRHDRKLCSYTLNYTKGIDILADTITCALHFGLIDNSVQGTYKIIDPKTGEIKLDSEGNEIKIRGKKNVKTYFEEHPDEWKALYDACYEAISDKENPFVDAFQEMMRRTSNMDDVVESLDNGDEI